MFKNMLVATTMTTLLCSNAGAAICDGIITSVAVQNDGSLHVRQANGGHWVLCNVHQEGVFQGVTTKAAACRSWQAILMAAQKAGTTVRLYMQDPNQTCSLADWSTASVYFVEDLG
ncbi:hypothetical protein JM946_17660 [Steroidobacter sp. S1-65]|uniref:Uncharacterized protein n=1 Tax=Steroidobacter gossypii TaxID=2805490 RepID=A0ABS1X028_9GAMM|nr:hypothetical protein [Steroidobacter gossypii]MBM0106559.1 hypothetical protein [Steroidobacter gossypii]